MPKFMVSVLFEEFARVVIEAENADRAAEIASQRWHNLWPTHGDPPAIFMADKTKGGLSIEDVTELPDEWPVPGQTPI